MFYAIIFNGIASKLATNAIINSGAVLIALRCFNEDFERANRLRFSVKVTGISEEGKT